MHRDSPPTPKPANKVTIVLGDFANTTGDPAFDGTLRQMLAVELGKSPYLSVLPDARMSETLRLMVRPPDAKLTPDVAAEICERTGSAAVVEGSIASLGSEYVLSLRARNCRTGDILDEEQAPAAKKEDVFKALGQMANRFGTRAGESLPSVEKEPSLPAEVTTPSLEAWRSYSAAMKALQRRAQISWKSISLLKRAIEIDPKFAMAYAYLGRQYADLGESELGAQNIAKAYELRDRRQRSGELFHHFQLPPAGNQKPGTGAADPGIVGAKVPRRSDAPRIFVGLHVAGVGSLRQSRGRRSKGDRTRSGFRHRLRKCGFCLSST